MDTVSAWLDRYVDARLNEIAAGANPEGPEMAELMAVFGADARYVDVPSGLVFQGSQELRDMFIQNYAWGSDQHVTFTRRLIDGHQYVLEGVNEGTNLGKLGTPGAAFALPFVCVGSFDDKGRVSEQRDYWDHKGWLVQIGADKPLGATS